MIWSAFGKFGSKIISFISNMVLARLLLPSDFGCIGMLQVFLTIADVLIVSGFASAIIQKQNTTEKDYSSVFYWNLVMSIIIYVILFAFAPAISNFYRLPILVDVLRVQSLILIINSFAVVQSNLLIKYLKFKELSIINVVCALIGTIVAIVMAYLGYGVWSLVFSALTNSIFGVLLLWFFSSWKPSLLFSWSSIRELFAFGGLMALSSIVNTIYTELQSLIIGRKYTAADLGYYTQARALESVPTQMFTQIVNQVSFPVFAQMQDEKSRLQKAVSQNIQALTYITFPLGVLLIVIASPLIHLLYGIKWDPAVPYFQILCITAVVYPINNTNGNIVKSLGKGKVYFYAHFSYRIIGVASILIGVKFGIMGLLWGVVITTYLTLLISSIINQRLIGYSLLSQAKDILPNCLLALISGGISFIVGHYIAISYLTNSETIIMLIQIIVFIVILLGLSYIFNVMGFITYREITKGYIKKSK